MGIGHIYTKKQIMNDSPLYIFCQEEFVIRLIVIVITIIGIIVVLAMSPH